MLQHGAVSENSEFGVMSSSDKMDSTIMQSASYGIPNMPNHTEICKVFWDFYRDTGGEYWLDQPDQNKSCDNYHRMDFYFGFNVRNAYCFRMLDLSSNNVSGTLPNYIWEHICGKIDLSNNSITALEILDAPKLDLNNGMPNMNSHFNIIDLSFNKLTQFPYIPKNHFAISKELYLDHNLLSGPIPNLKNYMDLQILDLSYNNLSGPIPDWIYSRGRDLKLLSFANNPNINYISEIKHNSDQPYTYDFVCDISGTSIKPVCDAPANSIHDLCNNIKREYHCLDDKVSRVVGILVLGIIFYNLLSIFSKKIRAGITQINSITLILSNIFLLSEIYMLNFGSMITTFGWLKLEIRLFVNIIALLWYTNKSRHNIADSSDYNGLLAITSVLNMKIKSSKLNIIELFLSTFDIIIIILMWVNGMNRFAVLCSGVISVLMLISTTCLFQFIKFLSKE